MKELFKFYNVRIKMRNRLVGGYPKNIDAERAMLTARGLEDLIPPQPDLSTLSDDERKALEQETVEKSMIGFKSNGHGLYIESRQVKAMFKECANILKGPKLLDVKNFKSKVAERIFVEPREILLGKTEPDGKDSRPVHVMTAMGPRTSIKTMEYVEGVEIAFRIKVLQDGVVTEDHIRTMLEYAQDNGLGADRSQGDGQFDLVEFSDATQ